MKIIAEQIHKHIQQSNNVVVVPHPNPDGDALGSANAITEYLKNNNCEVRIYCPTPINPLLQFLPNFQNIQTGEEIFTKQIDTIIVVDSGDLKYAGIDHITKNHTATVINIDHHNTNEHYGDYNFVIKDAASTTEILHKFFNLIQAPISHQMATNLLTGLITDTDNFTNSATSPSALASAGELVRLGANYNLINLNTQKNKTFGLLKLWGTALSRLAKDDKKNLVYTYIKLQDLKDNGLEEHDGDGFANFMNNIGEADITLILKETSDNQVKGSLRTTKDLIDVSKIAKHFGGGGHKKAAGFTATDTIEEVIQQILTLED